MNLLIDFVLASIMIFPDASCSCLIITRQLRTLLLLSCFYSRSLARTHPSYSLARSVTAAAPRRLKIDSTISPDRVESTESKVSES